MPLARQNSASRSWGMFTFVFTLSTHGNNRHKGLFDANR